MYVTTHTVHGPVYLVWHTSLGDVPGKVPTVIHLRQPNSVGINCTLYTACITVVVDVHCSEQSAIKLVKLQALCTFAIGYSRRDC